jgi:hypothetical protein
MISTVDEPILNNPRVKEWKSKYRNTTAQRPGTYVVSERYAA